MSKQEKTKRVQEHKNQGQKPSFTSISKNTYWRGLHARTLLCPTPQVTAASHQCHTLVTLAPFVPVKCHKLVPLIFFQKLVVHAVCSCSVLHDTVFDWVCSWSELMLFTMTFFGMIVSGKLITQDLLSLQAKGHQGFSINSLRFFWPLVRRFLVLSCESGLYYFMLLKSVRWWSLLWVIVDHRNVMKLLLLIPCIMFFGSVSVYCSHLA